MCRKKQRRYNKARKSVKSQDWSAFREVKKSIKKSLNTAHWDYINNILSDSLNNNDSKPFWNYIKAKKQDNVGISPLKRDGVLFNDKIDKAKILNDQFTSVFTQEDGNAIPTLKGDKFPSIDELTITSEGIEKLLHDLKPNKASGPDCVPARFLKETATELAPALGAFFTQSLNKSTLPKDWTQANITPVYKKGSRYQPENYRPVSLTCICCKVMEHVICKHIIKHTEKHSILTVLQHGFRRARSCESQLLVTIHDMLNYWNKNTQLDSIVLDFSKAFDTVPHDRLLGKLDHYGINGHIHSWISNFLKHRSQCVLVERAKSDPAHVVSGVPQGTVMGPLLFLLHINDLPENVTSKVRLFADDCLLYRPIHNASDQLEMQRDLDSLVEWSNKWGMKFNAKKCESIRMCRKRNPLTRMYTISGQILQEVSSARYLGVNITNKLDWSKHVASTTKKSNGTLAFLRRNLKTCPKKIKENAYTSLVRPVLEYGAAIWDPYLGKDISSIEMVQRRAARFVTNDYAYTSSVSDMIAELGWHSLADRRSDIRLITLFRTIHKLMEVPTSDILTPADPRTRSNHKLKYKTIKASTSAYKNSFFVKTIPLWNQLPSEIAECCTIEAFKKQLKHFRD